LFVRENLHPYLLGGKFISLYILIFANYSPSDNMPSLNLTFS
jgi:hypothetical protein